MTSPQAFIQEYPHVDTLIKFCVGVESKRMHHEQIHGVEEDKLPNKL